MIHSQRIHSLTEFVRNSKSFVDRIDKDKEPVGLTVNGKVKLVLLDTETFESLSEASEHRNVIEAILEGEKDIREGRTVPLEHGLKEIRAKYGL